MTELGQQIIQKVRDIAGENPDFVYTPPNDDGGACVYYHDGQPSCLIGRALAAQGVIEPDIESSDKNSLGIMQLIGELNLSLLTGETDWLYRVQRRQDDGKPWGAAVARTDVEGID